jgi:hypothetical protein
VEASKLGADTVVEHLWLLHNSGRIGHRPKDPPNR